MDEIQKLILSKFYDLEPEDYEPCEHCHGYGSSLGESCPTCSKCGGDGIIIKQKD